MFVSHNGTAKYTKETSKRKFSYARKTRVHKHIRTSTEFCIRHKNDLDYGASARTKRNLEYSG